MLCCFALQLSFRCLRLHIDFYKTSLSRQKRWMHLLVGVYLRRSSFCCEDMKGMGIEQVSLLDLVFCLSFLCLFVRVCIFVCIFFSSLIQDF